MIKVRKDLTGMRFGRLTVLRQAEDHVSKSGQHRSAWLVQCDCGSEPFVVVGNYLTSKNGSKSCGCYRKGMFNGKTAIRKDLTGMVFGRLVVLKQVEDIVTKSGKHYPSWLCKCDCGNECVVSGASLKSGNTKSCGCLHKEELSNMASKHHLTDSRLYLVWKGMKARCYIPSHNHYDIYGAKGITVCDEWKNDFQAFYDWAIKNGYDENAIRGECTLERKDVNGNYCPENCVWADSTVQAINQNLRKDNKTGVKGVNWDERKGMWQAQLQFNKKKVLNEHFYNFEDAVKARKEAEEKYHKKYCNDIYKKKS